MQGSVRGVGRLRLEGFRVSCGGWVVKNPPAMQGTWVQSLGQEDPVEKGMVTHPSILAWRVPWREEPSRLHSPWGRKESDTAEQPSNQACKVSLNPWGLLLCLVWVRWTSRRSVRACRLHSREDRKGKHFISEALGASLKKNAVQWRLWSQGSCMKHCWPWQNWRWKGGWFWSAFSEAGRRFGSLYSTFWGRRLLVETGSLTEVILLSVMCRRPWAKHHSS